MASSEAAGLWGHGDFLRLWGAQIASAFGSRITRTALPIIAILTLRATPTQVAILSALGVAPGVFVGLFAGGHVDRSAKRPLLVGPALLAEGVMTFSGGFFLALYMVMALETLHLSPAALGLIIGVGGVGAFAGALLAAQLGRRLGAGPAMALSLAIGASANLLIALSAGAGRLAVPLLVIHQLVGVAFLGAYLIHSLSLRQRVLPQTVLGRANAAFHAVAGLMLPAGALLAGPLAGAIGIVPTLWIGACGGLLAVPVLLAAPVLRTR